VAETAGGGWLLVRGRGDRPLPPEVDLDSLRLHRSTRRPKVQSGDVAVLYASVWQALFGVVEIAGMPELDPARGRWAWSFALRPLVVLRDLDAAPPVEAAGIFPQSLWRHSYIRLDGEQLSAARGLVEEAARAEVRAGNRTRRGGS
jgi:hypothetical protein